MRFLLRWLRGLVRRWFPGETPELPPPAFAPRLLDFGQKPRFLAVIDFECNCGRRVTYEVVEFPVVVVDLQNPDAPRAEFRSYVRPTEHPRLTSLCRSLTGIRQGSVDAAPTLDRVLADVDAFLARAVPAGAAFAVASDAPNSDFRGFLHAECARKGLDCPGYYFRWVDVSKHLLQHHPDTRCTLVEKVLRAGLAWEGTPHCGLDDARNIARLAAHFRCRCD